MSKTIELENQVQYEAPTVRMLLDSMSNLMGEIASLNENEVYPYKIDGVEKMESAFERAKSLANIALETDLYQLYETFGYLDED